MSAFKLLSNDQVVTAGNNAAHTFVTETPKYGKIRTFLVLVTVGSIKFNTGGSIVASSASHVAGESSEKVVLRCQNPETLFNFQGAGSTDSFTISEVS